MLAARAQERSMAGAEAGGCRFDHVAQQVPDVAAAVAWYRACLPEARVLYQDATWALLDACGVRLAFVLPGQHPAHLAWRVTDAELERRAAAGGHTIRPHRDGSRSFYVTGPGGLSVEIISFPREEVAARAGAE